MATLYKAITNAPINGSWGAPTGAHNGSGNQTRTLYTCPNNKYALAFIDTVTMVGATGMGSSCEILNATYNEIRSRAACAPSDASMSAGHKPPRTSVFLNPGATLSGQCSGFYATFDWVVYEFERGIR